MDEISNETVASTTVPVNSNISAWLNGLNPPVHEGYRFDYFDIPDGDKNNVTADTTVYIRYAVEGAVINGIVNDGDIVLYCQNSGWTYTGSADIVITFSKNFDTVDYDTCDIVDLSSTGEEKSIKPSTIEGKTISFTDEVIDTHDTYKVNLLKGGQKVGQTAFDSGFKPTWISVTQNGKTRKYRVFNF